MASLADNYDSPRIITDGMTFGYRIVAPRWAADALSGEGARKFGGRWNSVGVPMVYLGGSRALSALEMLVHLNSPLARAKPFKIIEVAVPKSLIAHYPLTALPQQWRSDPPVRLTQEVGDDWVEAGGGLALTVPSSLIPEETNILINPKHPDFRQIVIGRAVDFRFDQRL